MKTVFLLWHTNKLPDGKEDSKLLGVYESPGAAECAKVRAAKLPGFSEHIYGFEICGYQVGEDHWREGFVTVLGGSSLKA
jgi:hypothetical protein